MKNGNSPLYDSARKRVAYSTVGFLFSDKERGEVQNRGSGTLAKIGKTLGVVTAAHVLVALRKYDRIGIVHFIPPENRDQSGEFAMADCEDISFKSPQWTQTGPDLAFFTLPLKLTDALERIGCVFINLDKRRDELLNQKYERKGFWFVAGAVAERINVGDKEGSRVKVSVEATVEPGDVSPLSLNGNFDGYCFTPDKHPAYVPPSSYQGMSGGGLWVAHTAEGKGVESECSNLTFVGVNFWESDKNEQGRTIICHGPNGVYGCLLEAVRTKFR